MRERLPTRIGRWLAATSLALCACDDSRAVSGPSATETGNALQARLLRENGSPAAGARVAARRSNALDEAGAVQVQADPSGNVSLRLEPGDWTLEAREGGQGLRMDLRLASDTTLDAARLWRLGSVRGKLNSTVGSPTLAVAGLGRRIAVAPDGSFSIDSLPPGSQPLVLVGTSVSWNLDIPSGRTDSLLLDQSRPGELFQSSRIRTPVAGSPLPRRSILGAVETGWDPAMTEWTDSLGNVVPVLSMSDSGGPTPAWTLSGSPTTLQPRRILSGRAVDRPVFGREDGFRLALVFPHRSADRFQADTSADLSSVGGSVPLEGDGEFLLDPSEGKVRRAPLGSSLVRLDPAILSTDRGTLSLRVALEQEGVGRIWLMDWTDSVSSGLRVGIGAGTLSIRMSDTTEIEIPLADLKGYSTWNIAWTPLEVSVGRDGRKLFERARPKGEGSRTRLMVGNGGGIRLAHLLVLDRALEVDSLPW